MRDWSLDPKLAVSFYYTATSGSLSAGARAMGVSQPWMSEQIQKLETQVGGKVLIRTARQMELTDIGRRFLPLAHDIVRATNAAQQFASAERATADHTVKIGAIDHTLGMAVRHVLIERLLQRCPSAEPRMVPGLTGDLISQVIAGEQDVALIHMSTAE